MNKFTYNMFNTIEQPTLVLSTANHEHLGVLTNVDPESVSFTFNMNGSQEGSFSVNKFTDGKKCALWDKILSFKYIFVPEHREYYKMDVTVEEGNETVKKCTLTSAGEWELSNKIIQDLQINTTADFDWQDYLEDNSSRWKAEYSYQRSFQLRVFTDDLASNFHLECLQGGISASTEPDCSTAYLNQKIVDGTVTWIVKSNAYEPTTFYNSEEPNFSLLDRILYEKAPNWSIAHVDPTLCKIQREFSISGQSVYDALTGTIAKEINCLFKFDSVNRTISAYDLLNTCLDCGYRGDFTDQCPKCKADPPRIKKGYGKDTSIYISYENYSESMTVDGDESQVKNCFYVQGGDDYFTSQIKLANPNMSNYIYNFSALDYNDMPRTLVNKLTLYQNKYNAVKPIYEEKLKEYYGAVNNYYWYKTTMSPRSSAEYWKPNTIYTQNPNTKVFVKTLPAYYYLQCTTGGTSGTVEFDATRVTAGDIIEDGTVTWTVTKTIAETTSAVQQVSTLRTYLANNPIYCKGEIPLKNNAYNVSSITTYVKNVAAVALNSIFRITVVDGTESCVNVGGVCHWRGTLKITNTSKDDDEVDVVFNDTAGQAGVSIYPSTDGSSYSNYLQQLVDTRMKKDENTFTTIYKIPYNGDYINALEAYVATFPEEEYKTEPDKYLDQIVTFSEPYNVDFINALTEYGYDYLKNFSDVYNSVLDVLSTNNASSPNVKYNNIYDLYTPMYLPYYVRKTYIGYEMETRRITVEEWAEQKESTYESMVLTSNALNLESYLGKDLWYTFLTYLKESNYQNSNYVSGNLTDGEILMDVQSLLEIAEVELKKASTLQYNLSDNLNNLLNTEGFKDYRDDFELGDYLMCKVDDQLYKLRLIQVKYDYSKPQDLSVTFSNVTKIEGYFSDVQSVLNQAQSMSTTYQNTVQQVDRHNYTSGIVDDWLTTGLNTALATIKNNNMEEVTIDDHKGITSRQYNDVTGEYDNKQIRITHNILAFTKDNWQTSSLAIGELPYTYFDTDLNRWEPTVGWGMISEFVNSGTVLGSHIYGGDIYSTNYDPTNNTGTHFDLINGGFTMANGKITWNNSTLSIAGNITTESGDIGGWKIASDTLEYKTDGTHFIQLNSTLKSIIMRDGDKKVAITTGGIKHYYNEQETAYFRSESYSGTSSASNKRGTAINIESGGSYFDLGRPDSNGGYVTTLMINNGLNPDGITQKVIVSGDSYFKSLATFNYGALFDYNTTFNYPVTHNSAIYMNNNVIQWTVGSNDWALIGGGATGTNAGYLELSTGDDGSEPIYVTQYTGTWNGNRTIVHRAYLLDGSGNTSFPGTLTVGSTISTSAGISATSGEIQGKKLVATTGGIVANSGNITASDGNIVATTGKIAGKTFGFNSDELAFGSDTLTYTKGNYIVKIGKYSFRNGTHYGVLIRNTSNNNYVALTESGSVWCSGQIKSGEPWVG